MNEFGRKPTIEEINAETRGVIIKFVLGVAVVCSIIVAGLYYFPQITAAVLFLSFIALLVVGNSEDPLECAVILVGLFLLPLGFVWVPFACVGGLMFIFGIMMGGA